MDLPKLSEGEKSAVLPDGRIIIAHPDRAPVIVDLDGNKHPLRPYLCVATRHMCNPAREFCQCWWMSESQEHFLQMAKIKLGHDGPTFKAGSSELIGEL